MPASGRGCGGPQQALGGVRDFGRLRHAADAGFAGLRHLAGIGPDKGDAVARELRGIAAGRSIAPHHRVHRRRKQDRSACREQDGAGEIVGGALRHLRHQIGGRGRHHDQVAVTGQANMAGIEFALGIEQVGIDALAGQRARRQRRDELRGGFGEHAADADVPLLQPPDQVQRLVGRNAAADDQGDADLAGGALGLRGPCRDGGSRKRCGRRRGGSLGMLAQDHPHLLLDRAAVPGRAQAQIGFDGLVEFSDGQAGHTVFPRMIAMLSSN